MLNSWLTVRRRRRLFGKLRLFFYRLRRDPLIIALVAIVLVAGGAALGVTLAERYAESPKIVSLANGLWWAMVTMTTVGYGDMVPVTAAGRLVAIIVMISGIALVSVFTAAVSSSVITNRLREGRGLSRINAKKHIAILGWNPSAEDILAIIEEEAIRQDRSLVLVNQHQPEEMERIINKYQQFKLRFVSGDHADEEVLKRANISYAYAAIIIPDAEGIGEHRVDEKTILATLSVKSLNKKTKVVAHILDPASEPHLQKANADSIVVDSRYSGYLMAAHITSPGIPEAIDILLQNKQGVQLARRKIPGSFVGRAFDELSGYFKNSEDVILLGFLKESRAFVLNDILSDDYSTIDAFIKSKLQAAGKGLARAAQLDIELNPAKDYVIGEDDVAIVLERV